MTLSPINSNEKRPKRVVARPLPSQWGDEILTLDEAACLFWPEGPLTVRSLRTAARDGKLPVTWIAGKVFTTPEAIAEMTRCKTDNPAAPRPKRSPTLVEDLAERPGAKPLNESAKALLDRLAFERSRLKPRLSRNR